MKRLIVLAFALLMTVSFLPVVAQGDIGPVTVEFSLYENNPVLPLGDAGEWDSGSVIAGRVVFKDGLFHMVYAGSEGYPEPSAFGYATSEDGLTWTKYDGNPVLEFDKSIASSDYATSALMVEGDTWVLYVQPYSSHNVYYATAADPTGPWTVNDAPVLENWDQYASIDSIVRTDEQHMLYFTMAGAGGLGLATSPDGLAWLRHSDPVLQPVFVGDAWDRDWVSSAVVRSSANHWELFYTGGQMGASPDGAAGYATVGYATSEDGFTWSRYEDNPILPIEGGVEYRVGSVVTVDDTTYLYTDIWDISKSSLLPSRGIGVATGTIAWK